MVDVIGGYRFSLIDKSVRGASHERSGKPNQDSFKICREENVLMLSVADGHGSDSCPYSKSGSLIAVNVFCKIISEYCRKYSGDWYTLNRILGDEGEASIARAVDNEWKRRIEKSYTRRLSRFLSSESRLVPGKDNEQMWKLFGTTLLGLVITPAFVFAYQLGDGDIVLASETTTEHIITEDKLLGTETYSLSRVDSWAKAKTVVFPPADAKKSCAYILSTDGFSNSYRDEQSFLNTGLDYFRTLEEYGADAVQLSMKAWLDETSSQGSGDDITVLIAYCQGKQTHGKRLFVSPRICNCF